MKFKFILAIALILCVFSVLPVSAFTTITINPDTIETNTEFDIGNNLQLQIAFNGNCVGWSYKNQSGTFSGSAPLPRLTDVILLDETETRAIIQFSGYDIHLAPYSKNLIVIYDNTHVPSEPDFDIDIDLHEQTFELGNITNLEQTFEIGSSTNRVVKQYTSYSSTSCTIDDLQRNYVKIKLDKEYNTSEIFLSGYALNDSTETEFTTKVIFNYTYLAGLESFIQTYDYQTGNILSGVNMSIYEVIEDGDNLQLGDLILRDSNAESQIILNLKEDTEYFIENELIGYYAVKNENIASLNNRYGYLWNPTISNPLRLYYSKLDPSAQYNANFIVQDVNNNGIAGVSVTMDNSITKISNAIGGLTFNNVSAGSHTFTFTKNGYQTAQRTIDIQLQYAAFTQTLFKENQIIQPTVAPSIYPTTQPTVSPSTQPTLSPIDKPSNIMESVSFGFAKIFGVKTVENANYIFALMLILFPAVIAGGITHQALGFIAGGLVGFVFALAVGLVPVWVFFAMCLLAVIFMVLKGGNEGF